MARKFTVAAAQTGPVLKGMEMGIAAACAMVKEAARKGVDIICFPEIFLAPFFPNRLTQEVEQHFLTLPNPITDPVFAVARENKMILIFAYAERDRAYSYNSAAVFDRAGQLVGTYRKTHIPAYFPSELLGGTGSYEKFYFSPGTSLPVFEVEGIRFGIQICNDRLYPEPSRKLALKGAEIIFMPIAYATYGNDDYRLAILICRCRRAHSTMVCSWSPPIGSARRMAGVTSARARSSIPSADGSCSRPGSTSRSCWSLKSTSTTSTGRGTACPGGATGDRIFTGISIQRESAAPRVGWRVRAGSRARSPCRVASPEKSAGGGLARAVGMRQSRRVAEAAH
jgi:predicted amidohydrolase